MSLINHVVEILILALEICTYNVEHPPADFSWLSHQKTTLA